VNVFGIRERVVHSLRTRLEFNFLTYDCRHQFGYLISVSTCGFRRCPAAKTMANRILTGPLNRAGYQTISAKAKIRLTWQGNGGAVF